MTLAGQIRRYLVWFVAIAVLMVVAIPISVYILREQRFVVPWKDFYYVNAEFRNAEATVAGQGQKVTIAGVDVGEVDKVSLKDGLAVVRLRIGNRYGPIYRDAEVIRRPRTALKDLEFMLDPGHPDTGKIPDGGTLPSANTQPKNTDEFLSTVLDADARRGLRMTIMGLGGLRGNGNALRRLFEAAEPTVGETRRVLRSIASRRHSVRRLVTNLNRLSKETAKKDREISSAIRTTGQTFQALADEDAAVRESVRRLPETVSAATSALQAGGDLGDELIPAARELRPALRAAPDALRRVTPLLREATPILRDRIRPLVIRARPVVRDLRQPSRDLLHAAPALLAGTPTLNRLVNELAYEPPGPQRSYLFYLPWFAHNSASMLSTGDEHGRVWRGLAMMSCSSLQGFEALSPIISAAFNLPIGACADPNAAGGG